MPKKVSRKRTMRRKMKGGYYGATGAIPGAPGAMQWSRGSEMGNWATSSRGGNTQYGARRHRKSKKATKRHRKMKGGGSFGGVSASFQGTGARGLANYVPIVTRDGSGAAAGGAFNNFGAQPGSGHASFVKAA